MSHTMETMVTTRLIRNGAGYGPSEASPVSGRKPSGSTVLTSPAKVTLRSEVSSITSNSPALLTTIALMFQNEQKSPSPSRCPKLPEPTKTGLAFLSTFLICRSAEMKKHWACWFHTATPEPNSGEVNCGSCPPEGVKGQRHAVVRRYGIEHIVRDEKSESRNVIGGGRPIFSRHCVRCGADDTGAGQNPHFHLKTHRSTPLTKETLCDWELIDCFISLREADFMKTTSVRSGVAIRSGCW